MPHSNAQLLHAFANQGDESAFCELMERYLSLIYQAALRRSGNHQLAEEASQNVLTLLVRKAPDLVKEPARLPGWLHRAAILEAGNLLKKEKRHQQRIQAAMKEPQSRSNETQSAWQEAIPHLDEALNRLSPLDRQVVILHYLQGQTHRQIAEKLGKTTSAVQRQCHRCLQKLARLLSSRSVKISGTTLVSAFAVESTKAAPIAFVQQLSVSALTTSVTTTLPFLTKTLLLMTTTQKMISTAALVSLLASVPLFYQQQTIQKLRTQSENPPLTGSPQLQKSGPLIVTPVPATRTVQATRSERSGKPRRILSMEKQLEDARDKLDPSAKRLGSLEPLIRTGGKQFYRQS